MTLSNLLDKFNKEDTINGYNSISSEYNKAIKLASLVFYSDEFDDLEIHFV